MNRLVLIFNEDYGMYSVEVPYPINLHMTKEELETWLNTQRELLPRRKAYNGWNDEMKSTLLGYDKESDTYVEDWRCIRTEIPNTECKIEIHYNYPQVLTVDEWFREHSWWR